MPINISAGSPQIAASGNAGTPAPAGGLEGLFAGLIDLLAKSAVIPQSGQTEIQQSAQSFFDVHSGDLNASFDSAKLPASLADIAAQLGLATDGEPEPQSALAGLAAPLAGLIKDLAAKLESSTKAEGSANLDISQAEAALRLARGLIRQAGGGDVDLTIANLGRDPGQTPLAAQLRAAAADLDLVRTHIPIPSARTDAAAIFNGTAPTLDDLLNPQPGQNASGPRNEGQADSARLASTLGASLAAKAGANANQPALANSGTQTLAAALTEAGVKASITPQNPAQSQPDPLPNPQITPTGAPTLSSDISAAARPMQAAYQAPQINMQQLAFHIASQFQAGMSRFQIRMDPPELGRIDVRMDVDANGVVHARLAVDRAETLDMLRHDSRLLERALQQAGLDQNKTNLEFSLRQDGSNADQSNSNGQTAQGETPQSLPVDQTIPLSATLNAYQGMAAPGGLNLWV